MAVFGPLLISSSQAELHLSDDVVDSLVLLHHLLVVALDLEDGPAPEFLGKGQVHLLLSSDFPIVEGLQVVLEELAVNPILFVTPSHEIVVLNKVARHLRAPLLVFFGQQLVNRLFSALFAPAFSALHPAFSALHDM